MGGKHKKIRHYSPKFQLKNWQLILLLIPLLFVTATLLRLDHIKMTEFRDAVLTADTEEDDAKIAASLKALQDFTFSHIVINITEENGKNKLEFGTGPFYLEKQYLRHAYAALEKAEANFVDAGNPNGNVYAKAAAVCKPQAIANHWVWNGPQYINCMLTQIAQYPTTDSLTTTGIADLPSTELYRHNYRSPLLAPTPAGFAIVLCIVLILIIIIRAVIWLIIELSLIFVKKV